MSLNRDLEKSLQNAIKHFWGTRETQAQKQGITSGSKDAGARSAVTGGAQMNRVINLVRDLLCQSGLPKAHIYCEKYSSSPVGIGRKEMGPSHRLGRETARRHRIQIPSRLVGNTTTTAPRRPLEVRRTYGPPTARVCSSPPPGLGLGYFDASRGSPGSITLYELESRISRYSRIQGGVLREAV